jgi:ABC-type transport system involved in multi-copper enzyme maturation permease subunit
MRAIFWKEFRENCPLLWLGFALAVVIINVYAASLRTFAQTSAARQDLNLLCGAVLLGLAGLVVLATTANLFATEKARGTLPYLLALPVSRPRIWLAKALSALALSVASALLLFAPVLLLIPWIARTIHLALYLPDIVLWVLLVFAVTVFFSALLTRTISVVFASLVALAALTFGSLFAVLGGGVTLLGYDPALDAALLAFTAAPALILASLAAFARGELMQSARPWKVALPVLFLVLAVEVAGLLGSAHWVYPYRRAAVRDVSLISLPFSGSVAVLATEGSPAPFRRDPKSGWERGRGAYRSRNLVLVDLASRRDLLVLPHPAGLDYSDFVVSPDGRYLARRAPEDWLGTRSSAIEVWDLRTARRIYRGRRRLAHRGFIGTAPGSWSPNGAWLAVDLAGASGRLVVMRPDGSQPREIGPPSSDAPHPYDWDPSGEAVYTVASDGRLVRRDLPGGKAKLIWQPPASWSGRAYGFQSALVSPDGRWIALGGDAPGVSTCVVAADGSRAILLARLAFEDRVWSGDGRYLYLIAYAPAGILEISRWRAGDQQTISLNVPPDLLVYERGLLDVPGHLALPHSPSLLIWSEKAGYIVDEQGRFVPLRGAVLAALIHAPGQPGVDRQGRIIVASANGESLLAVDVFAGTVTKVYP